ncbi:MAG: hypothetical protein V4773_14655 [Verrucomicrobiota bacterium]
MIPRPRNSLPVLRRVPLALSLLIAATANLARAELRFVGILSTRDSTRFALTDTVSGKTSWITSQENFAGYKVAAFDAQADTLTLIRQGQELKLHLIDAKVQPGGHLELSGTITFGQEQKMEIVRATLRYDEENVFPLKDGIVYKITPRRLDDGTIRYAIAIQRGTGETAELISAPTVTAFADKPFSLAVGDYGFAFSPR